MFVTSRTEQIPFASESRAWWRYPESSLWAPPRRTPANARPKAWNGLSTFNPSMSAFGLGRWKLAAPCILTLYSRMVVLKMLESLFQPRSFSRDDICLISRVVLSPGGAGLEAWSQGYFSRLSDHVNWKKEPSNGFPLYNFRNCGDFILPHIYRQLKRGESQTSYGNFTFLQLTWSLTGTAEVQAVLSWRLWK